MKRDTIYRAYCGDCREMVRWQEPTGRRVDKILCPKCGKLLECIVGSNMFLKGEIAAEARTLVDKPKKRR